METWLRGLSIVMRNLGKHLAVFVVLSVLASSCSVPFRLQGKIQRNPSQTTSVNRLTQSPERLIENVHPSSVEEEVIKLSQAKIVIADYDLIRLDFPEMANKTNPEIDQWLLDQTAYISKPQAAQTTVNTSIPINEGRRKAFRPPHYGRALVYNMNHPETGQQIGLMDVKGAGALNPGQRDHGNGIATLGESLREFVWENMMRDVLADAGLENKTVGSYAVIDPGFDLVHADGSTSRAGFYIRQGHNRVPDHPGAWLPETDRMRLQGILHRYGIDPNRNIQGTVKHDLFDFGHFIVRDDLPTTEAEKQIPFNLWGYNKSIQADPGDRWFYSKKDYPWNWSHEFADNWSKGLANRDDAYNHFKNLVFPAREVLMRGDGCYNSVSRIIAH